LTERCNYNFRRNVANHGEEVIDKSNDASNFMVHVRYRTYRELAAVCLQTGRLLSLTRTLLLPVQGWHPVFRCEGLPGCTSNLPVLRDVGPFRSGSRSQ